MSVSEWEHHFIENEYTRRIGPWVLRVWFYDPAQDGTPDAPASWWWSVCLAGVEEAHVGVEGAPETLLRIGGDRCEGDTDGRRLAMDAIQAWLGSQYEHVSTVMLGWCACGASLARGSVRAEGRAWCFPCFDARGAK